MTRAPTTLIACLFLTACLPGSGDTFVNDTDGDTVLVLSTGDATTDTPSTGNTSSTSTGSTSRPVTTSLGEDTSTTGTTGEPSCGGVSPADACTVTGNEWCADAMDVCQGAGIDLSFGGGTNYCRAVMTMCEEGQPPCQICFQIANTCVQLGQPNCDDVFADCLCRADALGA